MIEQNGQHDRDGQNEPESHSRLAEHPRDVVDAQTLLSIVIHDLENPLGVARGNLEIASEECDSEHVDAAARATERMKRLLDELAVLLRNNSTDEPLEPVEPADVAHECWGTISSGDATLEVEAIPPVWADRARLFHAFSNLFENAIEHGGEDVRIEVGETDDADGLYVADDGTGIPPSDHAEVFEWGRSTADNGTGFGLPIVEVLAESHGWTVELETSARDGARIEITDVDFVESG